MDALLRRMDIGDDMKKIVVILLSLALLASAGCSSIQEVFDQARNNSDRETTAVREEVTSFSSNSEIEVTDTTIVSIETAESAVTPPSVCEVPGVGDPSGEVNYGDLTIIFADEDRTVTAPNTDFVIYEGSLRTVQVSIPTNPVAEAQLNTKLDVINEESLQIQEETIAEALKMYEEIGQADFLAPYTSATSIGTNYVSVKLLDLGVTRDVYYGGAHGGRMIEAYMYDLATGAEVTIDDICTDPAAFKAQVSSLVVFQIAGLPAESNPYFEGYETAIPEAFPLAAWSISDSCVARIFTITYPEYQIAPYAAGQPTFAIPLEDLKPYFNDYGLALFGWA